MGGERMDKTPEKKSPWTAIITITIAFLLVLVAGVFILAAIEDTETSQWAEHFKNRDNTCSLCLAAHNYPATVGDHDNMTPFILKQCPDCQPMLVWNNGGMD